MPDLAVVMPVYNEEGAVGQVLDQWTTTLRDLGIDYQIAVYNDGSRDKTSSVLQTIAHDNPRIHVIDKPNEGHGPTILRGYRDYLDVPWVFQLDSDGELGPQNFRLLWERRDENDFLIGRRVERNSPLPRRITTWISRLLVWSFYGSVVFDVNCPYRLFRPAPLRVCIQQIPRNTFAPNLILAGLASVLKLRVWQTDVVHTPRQTGEVSIKKWKLFKAACTSFRQTVLFRMKVSGCCR